MLNRWSVVMLLAGVLAGYTLGGPAVQAQTEPLPFATGDTVMLWYGHDAGQSSIGNSVECVVAEIRGAFVKCGRRNRIGGSDQPERWLTLKYVVQITKRLE